MSERYRAALVLKDLHGLGGRELAEVLEVSRPAADVLVHRARASFRRVFTGLAGKDATAPANLAVALPALAVPAALQAFPLLPPHAPGPFGAPGSGAAAMPGAPLAAATAAGAATASGAAPVTGVIAKIAAALTTKAALVAAGAAVVAGGGIAAVELGGGAPPAPASPGFVSAPVPAPVSHDQEGGHGAGGWAEHRRVIAEHLEDARHAGEGGRHAADAHDGGSGSHHASGSAQTPSASHDSTTHDSTATSAGSTDTTSGNQHARRRRRRRRRGRRALARSGGAGASPV